MSRTKSGTLPKLQRHKGSGQARVHIAGRDYWCGKWGSAAATAHYHRLIGEFLHGQGSPPRSEGGAGPVANPIPASQPCSSVSVGPEGVRVDLGTHGGVAPSITVCEIAARYLMHCEIYYRDSGGKRTSSYDGARMAIRALESFFDLPAHQFGPLRLQSMRALLVEQGRPRVTCNRVVKAVRRIFKWSASQELIVDRMPVIAGNRNVITVQRVPAAIYGSEASYPSWLFAANRWREFLQQTWTIEIEANSSDCRFLRTGGEMDFRFWFCRTHRAPSPS